MRALENDENIIIFISDGSPNDLPADIVENIDDHLVQVNFAVRIVTIGIGNAGIHVVLLIDFRKISYLSNEFQIKSNRR